MLVAHPPLRRSDLRTDAPFYVVFPHLSSLHHRFHHRLQQRSMRYILHQQPLRTRRRHSRIRTQRPRTRISLYDRLAING